MRYLYTCTYINLFYNKQYLHTLFEFNNHMSPQQKIITMSTKLLRKALGLPLRASNHKLLRFYWASIQSKK